MALSDLLMPDAVLPALRVGSKKQALQELAQRAASQTGLPAREILDQLVQRERLGSTGVGNGIAIPHGKLDRIGYICGVFARLERPIDYESADGVPVDLMFMLLTPEDAGADHLRALSRVARHLRDEDVVRRLRNTSDAGLLYSTLCGTKASYAA